MELMMHDHTAKRQGSSGAAKVVVGIGTAACLLSKSIASLRPS